MLFGEFVAEQLSIALHGISIDLEAVLILENPFTRVERILRRMEQTEVNDWLSVFTVLVEPLGGVAIVGAFTLRALIALQLNSDFLEAVLGDEDGEEPIGPVAILPNNGFAAVRTGPRVSDPLALEILETSDESRESDRAVRGCAASFLPFHA